jgi:integrase
MSAKPKGAHLYLRPARPATAAEPAREARWVIQDGQKRLSTGCGPEFIREAEERLAAYIVERHEPAADKSQDPSQISIADILSLYAQDRAPKVARPKELAQRMSALNAFFGDKNLGDINGTLCRDYAKKRVSLSMARRELADMRAAIGHYQLEENLPYVVKLVLPEKSQARERWLTRSEAARLLWHLWRYREVQKGKPTGRRSRRHVARWLLVALYTGTRASAICGAAIRKSEDSGFVDLTTGVFQRRAPGEKETKKRKPTIRLPNRLLAHLRRWERMGISKNYIVEWYGQPVLRISKAFDAAVEKLKMKDVTPHTTRHTSVTWAMQNGANKWDACGYYGLTMKTLEEVYGHHMPGHQNSVTGAFDSRKIEDAKRKFDIAPQDDLPDPVF